MAIPFKFHKDGTEAGQWIAPYIEGGERGFGNCTALTVGDPIIGAVIFHNYCPEAGVIEMSAAASSPRWLTRPVLLAMHTYVFDFCQMAVMRVSEENKRMLRIGKAYGYEAHRIPRLRGRDEAEIVLTLTDDQWQESRFNGKIKSASAS